MAIEEALAVLGLGPDASGEQARRAYLGRIKAARPETDPEGFMRLREAFEVARAWARLQGQSGNAVGTENVAHERREPEDSARPLELARARTPPDLAAALPHVGETTPVRPSTPTLAAWGAKLDSLVQNEQFGEAADQLAACLESVPDALPNFAMSVRVALRCIEIGRVAHAQRLCRALERAIAAHGVETQFSAELIVGWTVVRELCSVAEADPQILGAVARGALQQDFPKAKSELMAIRDVRPDAASDAAWLFAKRAPTLHAAVANVLKPFPKPARKRWNITGARWLYVTIAIVSVHLVRHAMEWSSSDAPAVVSYERQQSAASPGLQDGNGQPHGANAQWMASARRFVTAMRAAEHLSEESLRCGQGELSSQAGRAAEQIRSGHCLDAIHWDTIVRLGASAGLCVKQSLNEVVNAYAIACSTIPTPSEDIR